MDAEEFGRVEALLERLHPLPYQVPFVADVKLGVWPARYQIVDLLHWNHAHLPAHLDGDPLEIMTLVGAARLR